MVYTWQLASSVASNVWVRLQINFLFRGMNTAVCGSRLTWLPITIRRPCYYILIWPMIWRKNRKWH